MKPTVVLRVYPVVDGSSAVLLQPAVRDGARDKTYQTKSRVEMVAAGGDEEHLLFEDAVLWVCAFEKLLRSRRTRFIVQLFRLLSEPSMAAASV